MHERKRLQVWVKNVLHKMQNSPVSMCGKKVLFLVCVCGIKISHCETVTSHLSRYVCVLCMTRFEKRVV